MLSSIRINTIRITFILSFAILFQCIFIAPIMAEPGNGEKTFYFKDAINLDGSNEYDSLMGLSVLVSEDLPTKQNDSAYPPRLFNGVSVNDEEWIFWLSSWIFYFMNSNESLFGDDFSEYMDLLEGLELYLPHPFRIVETHENNGDTPIIINGDVKFDLYFSSLGFSNFRKNDEVEIGLYTVNSEALLPLPKRVKNITDEISIDKVTKEVVNQEITIEDVNITLESGDHLLFQIEIVPSNKTITDLIKGDYPIVEKFIQWGTEVILNIVNKSQGPLMMELDQFVNEIISTTEDLNVSFTAADAAEIINSLISSYFVYDSTAHPSSVTISTSSSDDTFTNNVIYYLHSGNIMDEIRSTKESPESFDLSGQTNNFWTGPTLERNKILEEASAKIYLRYIDMSLLKEKIPIKAELIYKSQTISSSTIELERTKLINWKSPTELVLVFQFDGITNIEIDHDYNLELKISVGNNTDFGRLNLRNVKILFDSNDYSSLLRLRFSETDHVKMNVTSNPINEKIVPGGSVKYSIELSSEKENDTINIQTNTSGNSKWTLTLDQDELNVPKGEQKTLTLTVTSSDSSLDGDIIKFKISATGKTGFDTYETYTEVSEQAVEYAINVTKPDNKTIKHGENGTYFFKVKNLNTGIWPDSYEIKVHSEHSWNLEYNDSIENLMPGDEKEITVTLFVPKNTNISSDILTFIATSVKNPSTSESFTIKTKVIGPNFIEQIYSFFESKSKELGLDDIFGSYGPHFLIALIFIILFFLIIIFVVFVTSKNVKICCSERIREIYPSEQASFKIILENPTKKSHNYHISASNNPSTNKWLLSLDKKVISLMPSKSEAVFLTVKPTDQVESKDWIEIDFSVKTEGKNKIEKISTMTIIKKGTGKSSISIDNVSHWPNRFCEGNKILTSFKIKNTGNTQTKLHAFLLVNGEEKNKLDDIVIPVGGYAEITMPWIAVKGKNEINILVK